MQTTGGFSYAPYEVRKLPLRSWGGTCQITNFKGEAVCRAARSLLRRHIHIRSLRGDSSLLLRVRRRFPLHYEVIDAASQERIGGLVRKPLRSLLRDEWKFVSEKGEELGAIREDSLEAAVKRRFFDSPLPQDFHAEVRGTPVCVFEQHPTLFSFRLQLRFLPAAEELLDPRFAIAAGVVLCLVEGRQRRLLSAWDF